MKLPCESSTFVEPPSAVQPMDVPRSGSDLVASSFRNKDVVAAAWHLPFDLVDWSSSDSRYTSQDTMDKLRRSPVWQAGLEAEARLTQQQVEAAWLAAGLPALNLTGQQSIDTRADPLLRSKFWYALDPYWFNGELKWLHEPSEEVQPGEVGWRRAVVILKLLLPAPVRQTGKL